MGVSILYFWNLQKIFYYSNEITKLKNNNKTLKSNYKSLALTYPFAKIYQKEVDVFIDTIRNKVIYRYYKESCGSCVISSLHMGKEYILKNLVVVIDSCKTRNEKLKANSLLGNLNYVEVADKNLCNRVGEEKLEYFAYVDNNGKLCCFFYPQKANLEITKDYLKLITDKYLKSK